MKERIIKLENFTNDTVVFFDYLSQYPNGEVPKITQVRLESGDTFVKIMLTKTQHRELENYIKNNK